MRRPDTNLIIIQSKTNRPLVQSERLYLPWRLRSVVRSLAPC